MRPQKSIAMLVALGLALLGMVAPHATAGGSRVQWQNYVSKHYTFTILRPQGWAVQEGYQDSPRMWAVSVSDPKGLYQAVTVHGVSPTGRDASALVRMVVADLFKNAPGLRLAPTARRRTVPLVDTNGRKVGEKSIVVFEGVYTNQQNQRKQFRTLVTGGDGLMLNQRIEAPEGQLTVAAPLLLQTLANLRVAKGVFTFDEGGNMAQGGPARQQVQLAPRRLAGGWGSYAAPANWKQVDIGKGQVIAHDPTEQAFFVVANADFITPRYARLARTPGMLVSNFCRPSQALVAACAQQRLAGNFRFLQIHDRPDLVRKARAGLTGGRPCSIEDFEYTFTRNGKAYKGITMGRCLGNYMDASFSFGHTTVWAPAETFDAWLPILGRMIASYELNREKVGQYIAEGLARYYAGLRVLGATIARNSEQMRRENLQIHMNNGRVRDYTSYLTTRMIMGEYDYLAGASGYVRGDHTGLYTAEGNMITNEPYGESITRHMTEINTRELYEAVRPQ
ncbi:MAG TPA: hypothetical protein VNE39_12545 [Planctomycetota bacterium]|nr:hypothetical protein [Planctomycetota bacterium]